MTLEELSAAGFEVSASAHALLERYVGLLLRENERLNLTAARGPRVVWRLHVCDSLALLPLIRMHEVHRLLDVGSGGGLPGVPLACACPELCVTLIDATGKKVDALARTISCLRLTNADVLRGRAEVLAHDPRHRETFDAVTARAVAALPTLLEYASGFVRPGGCCWLYKSARGATEERATAVGAARACQLEDTGLVEYRLPGDDEPRAIVCYRKTGPLDTKLPRRPGRATKRPL